MGVLVLGMHRSGTSALAGAFESMGYEVGPDDDVMPADIGNPEGYFELLSVVQANDDLLAHFDGRWTARRSFLRTGTARNSPSRSWTRRARCSLNSSRVTTTC